MLSHEKLVTSGCSTGRILNLGALNEAFETAWCLASFFWTGHSGTAESFAGFLG